MLRGLDTRAATADYEPTIVKVADRPTIGGSVTVYVDEQLSPVTRRRLRQVGERLRFFADAGVAPTPRIVRWPTERVHPSAERGPAVLDSYEEFRSAVGADGLGPFFERDEDGAITLPDLCVAFRCDGRLTGLYPRVKDGHVQTVDECLAALAAGNDVENASN